MFATNKEKFLEHVSALTAGTMSLFGKLVHSIP